MGDIRTTPRPFLNGLAIDPVRPDLGMDSDGFSTG